MSHSTLVSAVAALSVAAYVLIGYLLARKSLRIWADRDNRSKAAYLLFPHSFRTGDIGNRRELRNISCCWNRDGEPKPSDCTWYLLANITVWPIRIFLVNLPGYLFDLVRLTIQAAPHLTDSPSETAIPEMTLRNALHEKDRELTGLERRRRRLNREIDELQRLLAEIQRRNRLSDADASRELRPDFRFPDGRAPDWLREEKKD